MVRHDRFFLRLTSQLPRRTIHGDAAKIATDFSSSPVYALVSDYGDSAKASTPLNWLANVAFRQPARANLRRKTQSRRCRNAPPRATSSPMFVFLSRWGRFLHSNNGADCFEVASSPSFYAAVGRRSVWVGKKPTGNWSEKPRRRRRCVRKFGGLPDGR